MSDVMRWSSVLNADRQETLWERIQELPDQWVDFVPRGWIYRNMVVYVRLSHKMYASLAGNALNLTPSEIIRGNQEVAAEIEKYRPWLAPFHLLASIAIPNFNKATQTAAHNQTLVNLGQIACALERYRLAHGEYPATLDALVPQFMEKVPMDIIKCQPLHYQRTADGQFTLYSVGWNESDDGGVENSDFSKGDWVWPNKGR
jgi:hypothetical protein